MEKLWIPVYCLFIMIYGNTAGVDEFCETEAFNATCDTDEVIVMTHAEYGRMRVGRCVKLDYGHVGCSSQVLHLADTRCSGRRQCQIRIPDALFARTKPCPDDLKPYLEAHFECKKVIVPITERCLIKQRRTITASSGVLSNLVTQETGCGSPVLPWVITVKPGQKINVTLLDFAVGTSQNGISPCKVYAVIKERTLGRVRNITVCGALARRRNIYVSATNSIEIGLVTSDPSDVSPMFLVQYEALGCPDLSHQLHGWVVHSLDRAVIYCNHSHHSWQLQCQGTSWVGTRGNCSTASYVSPTKSPTGNRPLSYGSSILIILAVALGIGLSVLIIGLCCLKRHRRRLCGFGDSAADGTSDFSDDGKTEKIYTPTHYKWPAPATTHTGNKEPMLSHVRLDHPMDIYDLSQLHDTHCTPLLNNSARDSIYGQVRCTCPHVTPLYARAPNKECNGTSGTIETDCVDGPATSPGGSHYIFLDPDVIADQKGTRPLQLKTFGPSPRSRNQNQTAKEEMYPMCTIKQLKRPAPDKPPYSVITDSVPPTCAPESASQAGNGRETPAAVGSNSAVKENKENEMRNLEQAT